MGFRLWTKTIIRHVKIYNTSERYSSCHGSNTTRTSVQIETIRTSGFSYNLFKYLSVSISIRYLSNCNNNSATMSSVTKGFAVPLKNPSLIFRKLFSDTKDFRPIYRIQIYNSFWKSKFFDIDELRLISNIFYIFNVRNTVILNSLYRL